MHAEAIGFQRCSFFHLLLDTAHRIGQVLLVPDVDDLGIVEFVASQEGLETDITELIVPRQFRSAGYLVQVLDDIGVVDLRARPGNDIGKTPLHPDWLF